MQAHSGRIDITRSDCLFHDVGTNCDTDETCYFVLSHKYFGWHPTLAPIDLPFCYPRDYNVIPLRLIEVAVFVYYSFLEGFLVEIHYRDPANELKKMSIGVVFAHRWVAALRRLGVHVEHPEMARLTTVRGFVNNYGTYLWFGFLAVMVCLSLGFGFAFAPTYLPLVLLIWVPLAPLINLVMVLLMSMKARRGNRGK